MTMVSPAFALIVGPGNLPFIPIITFARQSGDQKTYPTSHLKCLAVEAKDSGTKRSKKMKGMESRGDLMVF